MTAVVSTAAASPGWIPGDIELIGVLGDAPALLSNFPTL